MYQVETGSKVEGCPPVEPLWLTDNLLVSSTLGLAVKRRQEEEGGGQEGGRKESKKRGKETCTHIQAHSSP